MIVSASKIIEGAREQDYVFWNESLVFGNSLASLSLRCALSVSEGQKIGEPKPPFTKATEATSVLIDSAAGAQSCPGSEDNARFCTRDCRPAARPARNHIRRMDSDRWTPGSVRSCRIRPCTGSSAWATGLLVQLAAGHPKLCWTLRGVCSGPTGHWFFRLRSPAGLLSDVRRQAATRLSGCGRYRILRPGRQFLRRHDRADAGGAGFLPHSAFGAGFPS